MKRKLQERKGRARQGKIWGEEEAGRSGRALGGKRSDQGKWQTDKRKCK
jgi:hypothetical protein